MRDGLQDLRDALARHDEWPTQITSATVVQMARRLVRAIDMRAQVIEQYRACVTPTEQALGEIMGVQP